MEEVRIEKLVHGGQGIGTLRDGRKVFVWNSLPGELVQVRLTKQRRDYAEGIAEVVTEPSKQRIEPKDEAFLSTSPWQIMDFEIENELKKDILTESFEREKVQLPTVLFDAGENQWHYRNKMEYSFWGDDDGLHLALFHRGSHGKRIVTGSSLARPEIDKIANIICSKLNTKGIRASQLKTVVVRCNQAGEVVAALYVKDEQFPKIAELDGITKGIVVYYSTPKSPASIITNKLSHYGDITLTDSIAGKAITYDVNSFFQVNVPVFLAALTEISRAVKGEPTIVDLYSGVGTIGLAVGAKTLVELDPQNITRAQENTKGTEVEVIQASSETAEQLITGDACIIVDPPRAGLHRSLVQNLLLARPQKIIYLSCNPATQARDISLLQESYTLTELRGYNFFPRTPHIESLAVLELEHV